MGDKKIVLKIDVEGNAKAILDETAQASERLAATNRKTAQSVLSDAEREAAAFEKVLRARQRGASVKDDVGLMQRYGSTRVGGQNFYASDYGIQQAATQTQAERVHAEAEKRLARRSFQAQVESMMRGDGGAPPIRTARGGQDHQPPSRIPPPGLGGDIGMMAQLAALTPVASAFAAALAGAAAGARLAEEALTAIGTVGNSLGNARRTEEQRGRDLMGVVSLGAWNRGRGFARNTGAGPGEYAGRIATMLQTGDIHALDSPTPTGPETVRRHEDFHEIRNAEITRERSQQLRLDREEITTAAQQHRADVLGRLPRPQSLAGPQVTLAEQTQYREAAQRRPFEQERQRSQAEIEIARRTHASQAAQVRQLEANVRDYTTARDRQVAEERRLREQANNPAHANIAGVAVPMGPTETDDYRVAATIRANTANRELETEQNRLIEARNNLRQTGIGLAQQEAAAGRQGLENARNELAIWQQRHQVAQGSARRLGAMTNVEFQIASQQHQIFQQALQAGGPAAIGNLPTWITQGAAQIDQSGVQNIQEQLGEQRREGLQARGVDRSGDLRDVLADARQQLEAQQFNVQVQINVNERTLATEMAREMRDFIRDLRVEFAAQINSVRTGVQIGQQQRNAAQ